MGIVRFTGPSDSAPPAGSTGGLRRQLAIPASIFADSKIDPSGVQIPLTGRWINSILRWASPQEMEEEEDDNKDKDEDHKEKNKGEDDEAHPGMNHARCAKRILPLLAS